MFYQLLPKVSGYIDMYKKETTDFLVASYTMCDPK